MKTIFILVEWIGFIYSIFKSASYFIKYVSSYLYASNTIDYSMYGFMWLLMAFSLIFLFVIDVNISDIFDIGGGNNNKYYYNQHPNILGQHTALWNDKNPSIYNFSRVSKPKKDIISDAFNGLIVNNQIIKLDNEVRHVTLKSEDKKTVLNVTKNETIDHTKYMPKPTTKALKDEKSSVANNEYVDDANVSVSNDYLFIDTEIDKLTKFEQKNYEMFGTLLKRFLLDAEANELAANVVEISSNFISNYAVIYYTKLDHPKIIDKLKTKEVEADVRRLMRPQETYKLIFKQINRPSFYSIYKKIK